MKKDKTKKRKQEKRRQSILASALGPAGVCMSVLRLWSQNATAQAKRIEQEHKRVTILTSVLQAMRQRIHHIPHTDHHPPLPTRQSVGSLQVVNVRRPPPHGVVDAAIQAASLQFQLLRGRQFSDATFQGYIQDSGRKVHE